MRHIVIILFFIYTTLSELQSQSILHLDEQSTTIVANQTFSVTSLQTSRSISSGNYGSCIPENPHLNSAWCRWIAPVSGDVTMSILPFELTDDIDFIIFRLDEKSNNLVEVRCSASGPIINKPKSSFNCSGETGLRETSNKVSSSVGCYNINNNYLEKVNVLENEIYYVHVVNFGSLKGFDITIIMDELLDVENPIITQSITWNIYPNPTVSTIKIELSEDLRKITQEIRIFDSFGRLINLNNAKFVEYSNQLDLDLNSFTTGIYNIVLYTDKEIYTKKILKL